MPELRGFPAPGFSPETLRFGKWEFSPETAVPDHGSLGNSLPGGCSAILSLRLLFPNLLPAAPGAAHGLQGTAHPIPPALDHLSRG